MRLVSSVGSAAACSSGVYGLLDWRRWSCHHASYRALATGQHYNATGALLLAAMLRSAAARPTGKETVLTDACQAKHPIWDTSRGCCVQHGVDRGSATASLRGGRTEEASKASSERGREHEVDPCLA